MAAYGRTAAGEAVEIHRIGPRDGNAGVEAGIITWGARIASLTVPAPGGRRQVLLTRGDMAGWEADRSYLGATVGRFAGRIEGARFTLDGTEHRLPANDGTACLHGGSPGFERAIWTAEPDGDGVVMRHISPDGDQGFPGQLDISVRFSIRDGVALVLEYEARTTAPTVLNLSNHAYFNLAGGGDVLRHELTIASEAYVPVGPGLIQNGPPQAVSGTPFDFRSPRRIGARIAEADAQLRIAGGYDHTYLLSPGPALAPRWVARVEADGLAMDVHTDQPAIQLYTGNFLDSQKHAALCLETQHVPNAPNRPEFASTVLRPGQVFRSTTAYRFSG
ncbi:MAG: galactose mutarotase [Alphaproteobacteria bacterium]|nr:galactose mutarotase [Alphaproteobacteria bacterium]